MDLLCVEFARRTLTSKMSAPLRDGIFSTFHPVHEVCSSRGPSLSGELLSHQIRQGVLPSWTYLLTWKQHCFSYFSTLTQLHNGMKKVFPFEPDVAAL